MVDKRGEGREPARGKRYRLDLCDGERWRFDISEEMCKWGEKIAAIMQLPECDGNPGDARTLRIIREEEWAAAHTASASTGSNRENTGNPSPAIKWDVLNFETIRFTHRPGEAAPIVCRLGPEEDRETEFINMQLLLFPIFETALGRGGFPFHATLVVRDGHGYLLAASGGGGKSTCARRIPAPWRALSDDLALVLRDGRGGYRAHPFPTWSDYYWSRAESTWDVHISVPVSAVFFVEHAAEDEATAVGRGKAAILINALAAQMMQPGMIYLDEEMKRNLRLRLFENALAVARTVPAFQLKVSLDGQFWVEMERVLEGLKPKASER